MPDSSKKSPPKDKVERCVNHAPYICIPPNTAKSDTFGKILQGCCNSWTCPRCGKMRAKHEYSRIVAGCEALASQDHKLYFLTITTRGKGVSIDEAHKNYLLWSNRLMSTLRANAKKTGQHWCYVQVTEHQKRGHPHSHIITTYAPTDTTIGKKIYYDKESKAYRFRDMLRSEYLEEKSISVGLGREYDISLVKTAVAVAKYVAKYLLKDNADTFPKHWKRVRYSRNFPKLPEVESDAFPILSLADWTKLEAYTCIWRTDDEQAYQQAKRHSMAHVSYSGKTEEFDTRFMQGLPVEALFSI